MLVGEKFVEVLFEMQVWQVFFNLDVVFVVVGIDCLCLVQVCVYVIDMEMYWFVFDVFYCVWIGDFCLVCVVVLVLMLYYGLVVEIEVMVLVGDVNVCV